MAWGSLTTPVLYLFRKFCSNFTQPSLFEWFAHIVILFAYVRTKITSSHLKSSRTLEFFKKILWGWPSGSLLFLFLIDVLCFFCRFFVHYNAFVRLFLGKTGVSESQLLEREKLRAKLKLQKAKMDFQLRSLGKLYKKKCKTGVINDPLGQTSAGQTYSPAISDNLKILLFREIIEKWKRTYVRMTSVKTNYHCRQWLWVGRVDQNEWSKKVGQILEQIKMVRDNLGPPLWFNGGATTATRANCYHANCYDLDCYHANCYHANCYQCQLLPMSTAAILTATMLTATMSTATSANCY